MDRIKKLIYSGLVALLLASCHNDETSPDIYNQGTNEYTNDWIYDQMQRYYFWNATLPGRGDLSQNPVDYFNYLLNPDDQFSFALKPDDSSTYPKGLRNSFGVDIAFIEHEGTTYGVILYVLTDSPAYYAGLKRGDLITAVNGITVSTGNYEQLYSGMLHTSLVELEIVGYTEQSGFTSPHNISLYEGIVLLQPIHSRVIQQQNHTVGYIEISHFDMGLSQMLLNTFISFKSQGVNEIVVDLRYNSGGDVSSATALCTLLAPNIQSGDLFIHFKGNNNGGQIDQSFQQALKMNEQQVSFDALRIAHPDIQRVFILCGSHSASASEIVINNLKPFMEVVTIGEKTVGKDTATFPLTDDRDAPEADKWVLYPAIYKLSNAAGEGNYATGIEPSITEDELSSFPVLALGEENEVLLRRALGIISGNGRISGRSDRKKLPQRKSADGDNILVKLPNENKP